MTIKLVVYVRVRKNKKGKTFPSYSTKMNIIVKGEEEKGAQRVRQADRLQEDH